MTVRSFATLLLIAVLAACDLVPPIKGTEEKKGADAVANARQLRRACASQVTYDRLKALAFDDALKVREGGQTTLDALATATVLRMEDPVAKSRDPDLNVTVCSGRMVIELPPGVEDAFGGERRLVADVEYSAQEAADGSGLVYQLQGAEPIIYRLAAIDLKRAAPGGRIEVAGAAPAAPVAAPAPAAPPAPSSAAVEAAPPTQAASPPPPRVVRSPAAAIRPPAPRERPAPPRAAPVEVAEATPRQQRAAARPSFNCRYARSRSERLVCGSDGLARRDRAMSSEFYAALASANPEARRELRATRDRFLRDRDRCSSEACVAAAYADRVEEIRAIRDGY